METGRALRILNLVTLVMTFVLASQVTGDCSLNPCENRATCLDAYLDPGYVCLCPSNFTGANCSLISNKRCQYSFSNTSGLITSPNYPQQHNNSENCLYHIRVPGAVNVTLNVSYMHTERLKDYLHIGPGTNESDWAEFSGLLDAPLVITFQTNQAFVAWYSDFNIIQQGWAIQYETDGLECEWPTNPCAPGYQCVEGDDSYSCKANELPCLSGPCDNGAECFNNGGSFVCICPLGYSGPTCSIDDDECLSSPCLNNGTCIDGPYSYVCSCTSRWTGDHCTIERDACSADPCLNNGECANMYTYYVCQCPPGFLGNLCEYDIDECASSPCVNGGSCVDVVNGYLCECTLAWSGKNCQLQGSCILDVAVQPNQTLAIQTPNFPAHYDNNQYCRWTVAGPEGTVLLVDTAEFQTELNYDWLTYGAGADPNDRESVVLQLSGSQVPVAFKTTGNRMWLTFTSDNDKTEMGVSVKITADSERDPMDECGSNPCRNGATCLNGIDKFACYCQPGFTGPVCQTEISPNMCYSNPCPAEAECISENQLVRCVCPEGFRHPSCSAQELGLCDLSLCKNNGLCTETANGLSFSCDCAAGWQGTFCERDVDECISDPCLNSGICMNGVNHFTCVCTPYWTGVICSTPVLDQQCLDSPCRNGAACVADGDTYQCLCQPGYQGLLCSMDINECDSDPCQHEGNCVNGINEYICQCPYGAVQGNNCEMTICETRPCQNSGLCDEPTPLIFTCSCSIGFVGRYCEVPISKTCESSYCNYNGICVVTEQQVMFCSCNKGYVGEFCEIAKDPCDSHQCQNYGTCFATSLVDYVCLCIAGYEGQFCHREIDKCASNPCINGGLCKNLFKSFSCTCPEGYIGDLCNTTLVAKNEIGALQGSSIELEWIIIIVVLSLFILIMAGLLCLCYCRRRKSTNAASSSSIKN